MWVVRKQHTHMQREFV